MGLEPDPNKLPLSAHPIFAGEGVDQARQVLSSLFTPIFLEPDRGATPFRTHVNGVKLSKVCMAYLRFENAFLGGPVEPLDFHTIQLTQSGNCFFNTLDFSVQATTKKGVVLSSGQKVRVHPSAGNDILAIIVKDKVLRDAISSLTGHAMHPPIRFTPEFELTQPRIASLLSIIDTFIRELDRPGGILQAPAAVVSFEHTLITSILFGLDHNLSDAIRLPTAEAGAAQVREIEQYLEVHAAQPIDMQTLAEETGHSVDSIYRAFRRHRDYTPMAFLRDVRMRLARERLLDAGPAGSVTRIAMACGFAHLGRFAVDYKRRFGESPSETLGRAAGD